MLRLTDGFNQLVLGRSAVRRAAQRGVVQAIFRFGPTRRVMAERLSGIGIAYPRPSRKDHRMVGRRMPDVDCAGRRLYEVLRDARFVLATTAAVEIDRPDIVRATYSDPALPSAVLVRPDGYVARASDRLPSTAEVSAALNHWCSANARSASI